MPRPQLKRADAKAKAEAAGATVGGDVTGKTTLVVNGGDGGAKLEKAKAKGIEIWDEASFMAAIGGGSSSSTAAAATTKKKAEAPAEEPAAKKPKGKGKGKEAAPPPPPAAPPASKPSAIESNAELVIVGNLYGRRHKDFTAYRPKVTRSGSSYDLAPPLVGSTGRHSSSRGRSNSMLAIDLKGPGNCSFSNMSPIGSPSGASPSDFGLPPDLGQDFL